MAYEYEKFILSLLTSLAIKKENKGYYVIADEVEDVYAKAKAFDEVKEYALSKNKDFEDRKDTARSNKEFNYFDTLQIANNAIINKCKQLEDE